MSEFKERLEKIKIANLKKNHKKSGHWPIEKKIEVVSNYLVLGNMKMVAATCGVDYGLVRQWKIQPWWAELEAEIRQTQNIETDTKLSKIVERSLEATIDRVENGDFFYDSKTQKLTRRPVPLRDVARVASDMLTKRELLRGNATERKETTQIPVQEQLALLAAEFAKWQKPQHPVIDVEVTDVEIKGNQESQVVVDSDDSEQVRNSDDQGGLGASDEGEQVLGARVDE